MAKSMIPPRTTSTRREILDVDGTPLTSPGSLGVSEKASPDGAGGMQTEKTLVSIVTVDGVIRGAGRMRSSSGVAAARTSRPTPRPAPRGGSPRVLHPRQRSSG